MILQDRSSIFSRLVATALAVAVVLVAGLWFITDQTIRATLEETGRNAVDVDLAGLVDIHSSGGVGELTSRIADRLALVPVDGARPHYLLTGKNGARLAGDIRAWPDLDPAISESGTITLGRTTQALARATQLGPDLRLLVAHEIEDTGPLLRRVGFAFLGGGLLLVLLVGLAARFATRRLQRRIAGINAAFESTDTSALVPLTHDRRFDEIDELAAHSAAVLDRVKRLMVSYRNASDQIAHEVRTPLTHLDGKLVKALGSDPDPATARHLVAAREDIRSLIATLESLLDIAASQARQGDQLGLKPVDLSALCESICELYCDSAEESGHRFDWAIAPGVTVDGEAEHLARLITNLLDNAFKYVPAGGTIELVLEPGPRLVVRDDGPGVPEPDRARIFERFYRSSAHEHGENGAGLGLALARAIAERHGWQLRLIDADRGARFEVAMDERRQI